MSIFRKRSTKNKPIDDLWSKLVKYRAGHVCEKCGKAKGLQSHHIFGRRRLSVRWDKRNGICLCPGCHTLSSKFSAHQTPTEFTFWIIEKRGQEWYDQLLKKANTPYKVDKEGIKIYLKKEIKSYEDYISERKNTNGLTEGEICDTINGII